jgi:hypothetical protein
MLRDLFKKRSAKRKLAQAQAEFDTTARAIVEANRAARASGKKISPEMLLAADKNSAALQKLLHAKHDLEQASGRPEPVELTELVHRKVCQLFSEEEQPETILLLEKQCGRGLPFYESAGPRDLERVRLAVLKLSDGNLSELRKQVDLAKRDWRDVLVFAEQPEAFEMGFVDYSHLAPAKRAEIDARDRQQYDSWLRDESK